MRDGIVLARPVMHQGACNCHFRSLTPWPPAFFPETLVLAAFSRRYSLLYFIYSNILFINYSYFLSPSVSVPPPRSCLGHIASIDDGGHEYKDQRASESGLWLRRQLSLLDVFVYDPVLCRSGCMAKPSSSSSSGRCVVSECVGLCSHAVGDSHLCQCRLLPQLENL